MSSIDERIVSMKFNNSQFQKGVQDTNKSLDDLKRGLKLDGATRGLQELDAAGKKFSLSGMASGVEGLSAKFIALSTIGITAISNITNRAVNAGITMAKSLTVDPIKSGLAEYELQLNSIQTILANTQSKGSTLTDVNAALAELNTYADKTIYNFAEMSRNIGTFTAAGLDLETSTTAIKGIANLAALSGSTSEQASTAMYQLSQAMSTGTVKLMDWNSVVNAGMGGQVFQDALKETARAHGVGVDAMIEKNGSFRDSLSEGWLSAEIMTETLSKLTGDLTDEQLRSMGYTDEQIVSIQEMARTASDAATKVKTFTQLVDTLQEAAGSGWATSWQILLGDFDEAKVLFTELSNLFGGMIDSSAEGRNAMLTGWKDLGGRTAAIEALRNVINAVVGTLDAFTQGMRDIFPPMTGPQLFAITEAIQKFTKALIPSEQTMDSFMRISRGVFSVLDIGWMVVKGLIGVIGDLLGVVLQGSGGFLKFLGTLGDWAYALRNAIKEGEGLNKFFSGLSKVLQAPLLLIKKVGSAIIDMFKGISDIDFSGASSVVDGLTKRFQPLNAMGDKFSKVWDVAKKAFEGFMDFLGPIGSKIGEVLSEMGSQIADGFKTLDVNEITDIFNSGLLAALVLMIRKFFKGGFKKEVDDGGKGIVASIKEIFGGVTDTLGEMQTTLKAGTLILIAGAIGILTASVLTLSLIDSNKLAQALGALGVMFTQLMIAMVILEKISIGAGVVKMSILAAAMIPLSVAILILSASVKSLSDLDWNELAKGLVGVAVLMGAVSVAAKLMSGDTSGIMRASIAMIAVGVAVKILASAVKDLSDLDWQEIAKGLVSVGVLLGALTLFTKFAAANKGAVAQSTGLILLGAAIKILASSVKEFADMTWGEVAKGFATLTAVLAALTLFTKANSGAKSMISTATSLVILGGAIKIIASALGDLGDLSWEQIAKGLVAMAGALGIITVAMMLMPPNMLLTAAGLVVVAAALKIIASAMEDFGGMTWEEIAKGMVVLAGSLTILTLAMYAMTGAIVGAAALIIVAGALAILAPAMVALGNMSWDEIGRGLTILASTLGILAVAGILILPAIPGLLLLATVIGLIGGATLLAGVGVLAFATALTLLTVAGAAGTATLVAMGSAVIGLIPEALQALAEGILAFITTLTNSAGTFLTAAVTLFLTLLQAVNIVAPQVVTTLLNLVWLLIDTLINNVPRFVDAGFRLILGLLDGIARNLGRVIDSAVTVIVEFINGISRNLPRITQAGADLILAFVRSLTATINNNRAAMSAAGQDLGWAIADGMTGGLASKVRGIAEGAANLARTAIQAAKNALDSHSPSKKFIQIGKDTALGMLIGIENNTSQVADASANMAESVLDPVKSAIQGLSELFDADMDMTPVIAPVMDLTEFENGSRRMASMLNGRTLNVDTSFNAASSIDLEREAMANSESSDSNATETREGDSWTFVQNNNSPKALSRAEIYRQTKNQLSVAKKGALVK